MSVVPTSLRLCNVESVPFVFFSPVDANSRPRVEKRVAQIAATNALISRLGAGNTFASPAE